MIILKLRALGRPGVETLRARSIWDRTVFFLVDMGSAERKWMITGDDIGLTKSSLVYSPESEIAILVSRKAKDPVSAVCSMVNLIVG